MLRRIQFEVRDVTGQLVVQKSLGVIASESYCCKVRQRRNNCRIAGSDKFGTEIAEIGDPALIDSGTASAEIFLPIGVHHCSVKFLQPGVSHAGDKQFAARIEWRPLASAQDSGPLTRLSAIISLLPLHASHSGP